MSRLRLEFHDLNGRQRECRAALSLVLRKNELRRLLIWKERAVDPACPRRQRGRWKTSGSFRKREHNRIAVTACPADVAGLRVYGERFSGGDAVHLQKKVIKKHAFVDNLL